MWNTKYRKDVRRATISTETVAKALEQLYKTHNWMSARSGTRCAVKHPACTMTLQFSMGAIICPKCCKLHRALIVQNLNMKTRGEKGSAEIIEELHTAGATIRYPGIVLESVTSQESMAMAKSLGMVQELGGNSWFMC